MAGWYERDGAQPSPIRRSHFSVIDSTQKEMGRVIEAHGHTFTADHVMLITADQQTAGVGTDGKTWLSPLGNLYATYAFPWGPSAVARAPHAAQVAALSVVETLRERGLAPQLKWINDVLLGGHKVSGMLCELKNIKTSDGHDFLMVGIGINVNMLESEAQESYARITDPMKMPLASMRMVSGSPYSIDEVLSGLSTHLVHNYGLLARSPTSFREIFAPRINASMAFLGERVHYLDIGAGAQGVPGIYTVRGLTEMGYIILESEDGAQITKANGKIRPYLPH